MKITKCTSVFLAFLLLVSNLGMAFNVHYCGDRVASISLKTAFSSQNFEKNCCGIVKEKSKCCNDKVVSFQQKSDNLILKIAFFHSDFIFLAEERNPDIFTPTSNFKSTPIASYFCDSNAPPFFKLYHQYVFYA